MCGFDLGRSCVCVYVVCVCVFVCIASCACILVRFMIRMSLASFA